MKMHHIPAVALAGVTSALIAIDAVVRAVTGHASLITDDARGGVVADIGISLVIGLTFGACALVLHREVALFAGRPRPVRAARTIAMVGLAVSAIGQVAIHPVEAAIGVDTEGPWAAVSGLLAILALLVTFLSALVLGIGSVRHNHLGVGGRVLSLLVPVIALTAVLAVVVPSLASPVFCTTVVLLGFASIGLRATEPRQATATPARETV